MAALQNPLAVLAGESPLSERCVLIVENNLFNMKLFESILAAQGWRVLKATDGLHALSLAHAHHPDLIIMDIGLPGMSGVDVTRHLKTDGDTRDIPIIATTAYEPREFEEDLRSVGCDELMAKPIAINAFLDLCELLLERSARRSESEPSSAV